MIEIEQKTLFDYGSLDHETRMFVQEKAQSIQARLKRTAEDVIAIGLDLIAVKGKLGHGHFMAWVQVEFGMTHQSAKRFIDVAKRFGNGNQQFVDFPVSVLYELAAPSTPDDVVEMVESGQIPPTIPAIREAKREIQEQAAPETNYTTINDIFPGYTEWKSEHTPASSPATVPFSDDVDEDDAWTDSVPSIQPEAKPVPEIVTPTLSPEALEIYHAELREKRWIKEQEREQERDINRQLIAKAKTIDETLATAKFSTIVIDPPWSWEDEGDVSQFGRGNPTYGTMTIDELLALPVGNYADDDCHLYLWITNRSLPKGFRLLDAWGFRYVTCVTWKKPSFGMGNYFRGQTEHLLFGVKGSLMLKRKDVGTIFEAPRGPKGHSSKPVEAYSLIESCSPGPYLELFARSQRPDWTSWGAEV